MPYIIELKPNVWVAGPKTDDLYSLTALKREAQSFENFDSAVEALVECRKYRPYPNANIYTDTGTRLMTLDRLDELFSKVRKYIDTLNMDSGVASEISKFCNRLYYEEVQRLSAISPETPDDSKPKTFDDDRKKLFMAEKPLEPGTYELNVKVLCPYEGQVVVKVEEGVIASEVAKEVIDGLELRRRREPDVYEGCDIERIEPKCQLSATMVNGKLVIR